MAKDLNIQKKIGIHKSMTVEKITKRVDRMMKVLNMKKVEQKQKKVKEHRGYFSKQFFTTLGSKNGKKWVNSTPVRDHMNAQSVYQVR